MISGTYMPFILGYPQPGMLAVHMLPKYYPFRNLSPSLHSEPILVTHSLVYLQFELPAHPQAGCEFVEHSLVFPGLRTHLYKPAFVRISSRPRLLDEIAGIGQSVLLRQASGSRAEAAETQTLVRFTSPLPGPCPAHMT